MYQSGTKQTHLLELFSTQSCSSCPPAQAKVNGLKGHRQLWKSFIPVVFHVDYWDYLGWKDPYSKESFSDRQRRYVRQWSADTAYTPMFVVDGEERRRRNINDVIRYGANVGVLKVETKKGGKFTATYQPIDPPRDSLYINYAILGGGISTDVTAGENTGKTLNHEFLVLKYGNLPLQKLQNTFTASFQLNTDTAKIAPSKSLVFWVTAGTDQTPIQTTGGQLQ